MLFVLLYWDKPGRFALRQQTRPAHLAYIKAHERQVRHGGPLLDDAGQPIGSLLVIEAPDRAAAEAFAANDPYVQAGLFESVVIRATRIVVKDGAWLE